jgi:hypothetical protein
MRYIWNFKGIGSLVILACVLFACKTEDKHFQSTYNKSNLKLQSSLKVDLPPGVSSVPTSLVYDEHSQSVLYYDDFTQKILFFSPITGAITDSLFLVDFRYRMEQQVYEAIVPKGGKYYMFNRNIPYAVDILQKNKQDFYRTVRFHHTVPNRSHNLPFNKGLYPAIINDSTCSFLVIPDDFKLGESRYYYEVKLSENNADTLKIKLPHTYLEGPVGTSHYIPSRIFNDGKFIYSFPLSDSIYFVNEVGEITKKPAGSKFFSEQEITFLSHSDSSIYVRDLYQYQLENFEYGDIIFDPYRKIYLRLCFRKLPFKNKSGKVNFWEEKPLSILIFDQNFNFLDELVWEGVQPIKRNLYFISPEGIWFALPSEKSSLEMNSVTFSLFSYHEN